MRSGVVCLAWLATGLALSHSFYESSRLRHANLQTRYGESRFVFADLDGDHKPDLAQVESQSRRSAKTNYSIHVRFSEGAESAIGVNGPIGGLRVAARDVNGDDALDLVVTSNLDVHFIKVLLNDGRGNFSSAAPGNFPQLDIESALALESPGRPQTDQSTLAFNRGGFESAILRFREHGELYSSDWIVQQEVEPVLEGPELSGSGRSPPSVVPLS